MTTRRAIAEFFAFLGLSLAAAGLLSLLWTKACPAQTPTLVQFDTTTFNSATTVRVPYTGAVTSGHLLKVCASVHGGPPDSATAVQDKLGTSFTTVKYHGPSSGSVIVLAYGLAAASGTDSILVTYASSFNHNVEIEEVSNIASSNFFDQSKTNESSAASPSSGAFTTAVANEYLTGCVNSGSSAWTVTVGNGTLIYGNADGVAASYLVDASASADSIYWSGNAGANASVIIVGAFKPGAASGPTGNTPQRLLTGAGPQELRLWQN